MPAAQKQLRFFFNQALFYATITSAVILSSGDCLALEQHPPFSYYQVIEQRNIFRPKADAVDTVQQPKPAFSPMPMTTGSGLDNYALTGVVKIRGKYKATITDKNSKSGHYVGNNDLIGDLKVLEIQSDRVILEKDSETYELKINAPASRVIYERPSEGEKEQTKIIAPQETIGADEEVNARTNVMKSIRMGSPHVQRQ